MNRLEEFLKHRKLLFAIAYRMLGTVVDAEDMMQEAWLRWQAYEAVVESPKAFLFSLITRLCIDYLRSARVQREQYVGLWLPEPLVTQHDSSSDNYAELAESLSFAFITLLECLSPTERAVFLLREVFNYDYSEVANIVGKSISNCRQIVRRARQHLALRRPHIHPSPQQKEKLIEQFLASWNQGDTQGLVKLMAEDVTSYSDGGGQVIAARKPLHGCLKVARFLIAIRRSQLIPMFVPQVIQINGQLGILNTVAGIPQSIVSFEFEGEKIQSIFAVLNPEKLKAIQL